MKTKILFVIDSLECAGAEKSLISLLSLLDYKEYEVYLKLFGYGGILEKSLPKEVNILDPMAYTKFSELNLNSSLKHSFKTKSFDMLLARLRYSLAIRTKQYSNEQKAIKFWQCTTSVIEEDPTQYDIAISYAQGVPTFYVAEKINAKRKFAWVNNSFRINEADKRFYRNFYDEYTNIVTVSGSAKEIFLETFPIYNNKVKVIYDINNYAIISSMSELGKGYQDSFDGLRILTIGRLDYLKGYDIAIKACKKLKEIGIEFRWYALGKGPLETEIKELIKLYNLQENFVLLGVETNPYPYIKNTDVYVQTSRSEGFGLAIAEARMLNVPVVTTKFDAVFNQMTDKKNGLVVEMNPESVCEGILKLIENQDLREGIIKYLSTEKKGNVEEIEKFYQLIS